VRFTSDFPTIVARFLRVQISPFEYFDWSQKWRANERSSRGSEFRRKTGTHYFHREIKTPNPVLKPKHTCFFPTPVLQTATNLNYRLCFTTYTIVTPPWTRNHVHMS